MSDLSQSTGGGSTAAELTDLPALIPSTDASFIPSPSSAATLNSLLATAPHYNNVSESLLNPVTAATALTLSPFAAAFPVLQQQPHNSSVTERTSLLTNNGGNSSSRGSTNRSKSAYSRAPCSDVECCIQGCLPYAIDYTCYMDAPLLPLLFVPLTCDAATQRFLYHCRDQYDNPYSYNNLMTGIIKPMLKKCLAHTDLNGLLRTGQMFLASTAQLRYLLKNSASSTHSHSALNKAQQNGGSDNSHPDTAASPHLSSTAHSPAASPSAAYLSYSQRLQNDENGMLYPWGSQRTVKVLDVGAGDGRVSTELVACFDDVSTTVTEVSSFMCKRLRARGYKVHNSGDLDACLPVTREFEGFDVISCFNVIDRCSTPITLLKQIKARLRDQNSRVILATPLPLNPSVEIGKQWVAPAERIAPKGKCWCCESFESASIDLARLLIQLGFRIHSFSRIPYLSLGDTTRAFYTLDDAVFILSRA